MRRRVTVILVAVLALSGCARPAAAAPAFGFQPLWPFTDQAAADAWLQQWKTTGEQVWQADPSTTALKFTREFLGFTDLDRTTTADVQAREAWIGVGQADPLGRPHTVATLHLVRFGPDPDAPWEVVGSEDRDLTLESPAYGSPMPQNVIQAGGTISGVDESLHLTALQPGQVLGEFCCVPAGGQGSTWSATVPVVQQPRPGAVTIVVSTGGHYALIERFAVTGVAAG